MVDDAIADSLRQTAPSSRWSTPKACYGHNEVIVLCGDSCRLKGKGKELVQGEGKGWKCPGFNRPGE